MFGLTFKFDRDAIEKILVAAAIAAALAALGVIQANLASILAGHETAQVILGAVITAAIATLSKKA